MRRRPEMEQLVDRLGYDFGRFALKDFVSHIGQHIQRKIIPIACVMPHGTFGAWLTDGELPLEYVMVDKSIGGQHAIHIHLHELGHIILKHRTGVVNQAILQKMLLMGDSSILSQALHRRASRLDDEQDAEMFAMIVQERLMQAERKSYLGVSSSSDMMRKYLDDIGVN